jgi:hypothetical protein
MILVRLVRSIGHSRQSGVVCERVAGPLIVALHPSSVLGVVDGPIPSRSRLAVSGRA